MNISELFNGIECDYTGPDLDITSIEYDSRAVKPGDLFVCIVGTVMDGHEYAAEAVASGAAALLVSRRLPVSCPQILVADTRAVMAVISAQFFGHPERKLKMVGITGTNGKTTTTFMVKAIAEKAGYKVGLIGTISNMIGDEKLPTDKTTPESVDLMRLLAQMVESGVDICVMEVSSHSLDQRRVYGIAFDVGVFTNLTQDHLDYHKTVENYRSAKKKLLLQSRVAVVNADDASALYMVEGVDCKVTTFAVRENGNIYANGIDISTDGVSFNMHMPKGDMHVRLLIPGLFSVYNAMAAAGVCQALGISAGFVKAGLEELSSVAGRLEKLNTHGRPFSILLDFAHTPDALENILKTIRTFAKGRIVTLFGCGGDRDKAKRPIMGEIAGRYSDYCIVTSDNPRSEKPLDIIKSVEDGVVKSGCEYVVIENRRDAIEYAIAHSLQDDILVLAGKGHETYQVIKGQRNHFDEKEIVEEIFAALDKS